MSQGRFPGPRSGTFPCCFKTVCRLTKDGLLYNHGPRSGPCPGTGRRPTFVSSQPTPTTLRPRLPQVSPQALGQGRITRTGTAVDYFSQSLPSVQSLLVPISNQQPSLSAVSRALSRAAPEHSTIAADSRQDFTSPAGLAASVTTTSHISQLRPGDTLLLSHKASVQPHLSSAAPSAQHDSVGEHSSVAVDHHQRSMDPGVGVGDGYVEAVRELFCKPKSALIKWIPKSARHSCATLFTKLLATTVVEDPQSTDKWITLLLFGQFVLVAPQSSGHSKGVSSQITAHCQEFTTTSLQGKLDKLFRETVKQEHGMARKHRTQSDEENLAHEFRGN